MSAPSPDGAFAVPPAGTDVRRPTTWRTRLLWALLLGALAGTALAQTAAWWWPGELVVHWTLHAAVVLTVVAALLRRRHGAWLAMAGVVLAAWPWLLAAWSPRAPLPAEGQRRLRLVHANIHAGNGADARALLPAVDADLVTLVEARPRDRAALAGDPRWPHQAWFLRPPRRDGTGEHGVALLSRHPLAWSVEHDLGGECLLEAEALVDGRALRVMVAHPKAPMTPRRMALREANFARIAASAAAVRGPLLAVGDWNCTVASPSWRAFSAASGLRPPSAPTTATWPSPLGPFGIRIDHVLASGGVAIGEVGTFAVPGSDHRGISADIAF